MSEGPITEGRGPIVVRVEPELEELIPGFLQHRRDDAAAILAALEGRNFNAIRVAGHTLKGIGGGYGFDEITTIGEALERAGAAGEPETVRRCVGRLWEFLDRVQVVFG